MIKYPEYNYLIGKTKQEILNELGFQFNFYPDDEWIYEIDKNWFFIKTVMIIHFEMGVSVRLSYKRKFSTLKL